MFGVKTSSLVYQIIFVIAFSHSMVNPIFYVLYNQQIRKAFVYLLRLNRPNNFDHDNKDKTERPIVLFTRVLREK